MRHAMRGDPDAREVLFRKLYPRVYRQARRLCSSHHAAEDLAQTALLTAHRRLNQVRDRSGLLGWMTQVVRTTHLLSLRRQHFAPLGSEELSLNGRDALAPEGSPQDRLAAMQTVDAVLAGIRRLSPGLRSVLELRIFGENDTAETARVLGISEAAVRTRLKRARQALSDCAEVFVRRGERCKVRKSRQSRRQAGPPGRIARVPPDAIPL